MNWVLQPDYPGVVWSWHDRAAVGWRVCVLAGGGSPLVLQRRIAAGGWQVIDRRGSVAALVENAAPDLRDQMQRRCSGSAVQDAQERVIVAQNEGRRAIYQREAVAARGDLFPGVLESYGDWRVIGLGDAVVLQRRSSGVTPKPWRAYRSAASVLALSEVARLPRVAGELLCKMLGREGPQVQKRGYEKFELVFGKGHSADWFRFPVLRDGRYRVIWNGRDEGDEGEAFGLQYKTVLQSDRHWKMLAVAASLSMLLEGMDEKRKQARALIARAMLTDDVPHGGKRSGKGG